MYTEPTRLGKEGARPPKCRYGAFVGEPSPSNPIISVGSDEVQSSWLRLLASTDSKCLLSHLQKADPGKLPYNRTSGSLESRAQRRRSALAAHKKEDEILAAQFP